jgi:anti-sigma factor RsiW
MTEMACNELVDVITEYLEGTLPAGDRARFEAHLPECPFCTEYLAQMRATIDRLGREEAALSPPARAALLAAFRDARG